MTPVTLFVLFRYNGIILLKNLQKKTFLLDEIYCLDRFRRIL